MWYWVCEGDESTHRMAFTVIKCTRNPLVACTSLLNTKRKDLQSDHWIRRDPEHSDPNYKQYECPACGNKMSKRELDDTWDWAGPHCNACGCTGMSMFASVTALKPIMSGWQGIMASYASILGQKTMDKIDRKERAKKEG